MNIIGLYKLCNQNHNRWGYVEALELRKEVIFNYVEHIKNKGAYIGPLSCWASALVKPQRNTWCQFATATSQLSRIKKNITGGGNALGLTEASNHAERNVMKLIAQNHLVFDNESNGCGVIYIDLSPCGGCIRYLRKNNTGGVRNLIVWFGEAYVNDAQTNIDTLEQIHKTYMQLSLSMPAPQYQTSAGHTRDLHGMQLRINRPRRGHFRNMQ